MPKFTHLHHIGHRLNVRKALQQQGGSKDGSREHEVGGHGNYDEIDDERKLKR